MINYGGWLFLIVCQFHHAYSFSMCCTFFRLYKFPYKHKIKLVCAFWVSSLTSYLVEASYLLLPNIVSSVIEIMQSARNSCIRIFRTDNKSFQIFCVSFLNFLKLTTQFIENVCSLPWNTNIVPQVARLFVQVIRE